MFTDQQNLLASYFKAFGHPARVAIIQHLFKINACVCGDLVEEIGLAQPTISQHLKELKLHCDLRREDKLFYFSNLAFPM